MASRREYNREVNIIDLHLHTNFSDGELSPEELMKRCRQHGLRQVAVADHDTVEHIVPAKKAGAALGIEVWPATELSVIYGEKPLHLLGYGFRPTPTMQEALASQKKARVVRIGQMADRLRALGWQFDRSALLKDEGTVGRPALAAAVVQDPRNRQRLGQEGLSDQIAFLQAYLVEGEPAYVERERLTIERGVGIIHEAGGVAVWAHPWWTFRRYPERVPATLDELAKIGLDGVEAFYPTHSKEQVESLLAEAKRLNLLVTAGSDYHGPHHAPTVFPEVGAWQSYGQAWVPDPRLKGENT